MDIRGFQGVSLIDYPGTISSVIFTGGCNFKCPYCQNPSLIIGLDKIPEIPAKEILEKLEKRKKFIDGVVITGGESTINKDLPNFLREIKRMGFKIKLDTNGSFPDMIKEVINEDLLDFIAMDYKSPISKYRKVMGAECNPTKIAESVNIIKNRRIHHEFRTTIHPKLHSLKDIIQMSEELKGTERYVIQQFSPLVCLDTSYQKTAGFAKSEIEEILPEIKKRIPCTILRGF